MEASEIRRAPADIAEAVRSSFERDQYGDTAALNDQCRSMSMALYSAFKEAGYTPSLVAGQYLGADDAYTPDTSEWEEEEIDNFDRQSGFSHWWIEVEGYLIDICADQFHPGARQDYRIVLTSLPARDYERMVDQPDSHPAIRLGGTSRRP